MEKMTLGEIALAVGGRLNAAADTGTMIERIGKDSREENPGGLFAALRGDKFDGHEYISGAVNRGARAVLSERETPFPTVLVPDTKKALLALAEYYRGKFSVPVVCVTGSSGKTTTKELVASVLEQKVNVCKSEKNYNNEIGLPFSIFSLDRSHGAAVWELGISHPGEMAVLSKAARPDVGVITNVGTSHIGPLGGRDGIFNEKKQIFTYMQKGGAAVLPGDDERFLALSRIMENAALFGLSPANRFHAINLKQHGLEAESFTVAGNNPYAGLNVTIRSPGKHMAANALAAAAVGSLFGLTGEEVKRGLEAFAPQEMRMNVSKTGGLTVINDTYNANPDSVRAALDVLAAAGPGAKAAVLGDMLELDEYSAELHYETGRFAAKLDLALLAFAGPESRYAYEGVFAESAKTGNAPGRLVYFDNKEELTAALPSLLPGIDFLLLKASRGMGFETVAEEIQKGRV